MSLTLAEMMDDSFLGSDRSESLNPLFHAFSAVHMRERQTPLY